MRNTKVAGQRIPTTKKLPNSIPVQSQLAQAYSTQPPSVQAHPNYAPAVPISIYRQLSTELQATKVTMDSLKTQNQQLLEQNHLLKQELERIASRTQRAVKHFENLQEQSGQPLGQVQHQAATRRKRPPEIASDILVEDYIEELPIVPEQFYRAIPEEMADTERPELGFSLPSFPKPKLVYEQAFRRPLANLSEASTDIPTWKLSAVIALIICSAFGAGFLIVRPLLSSK